jgi:hypothetical protein
MQVVIDVPNWLYFAILEHKEPVYSQSLGDAVRDGTPLPKGHGRLIDADKVISDGIDKGFCDWYDELKYADTIIEADKEDEA